MQRLPAAVVRGLGWRRRREARQLQQRARAGFHANQRAAHSRQLLQHYGEAGQSATKPEKSSHSVPPIRGRAFILQGWLPVGLALCCYQVPTEEYFEHPSPRGHRYLPLRNAFSPPSPFLPTYASPPSRS